ncbi:MAG: OsmC family protein [Bacteroidetes bacterium]|nr:OsmC family protein [Bacteroidota bacterium]
MSKHHHYTATIRWTGNNGTGTSRYDAYERSHIWSIAGKPDIECSSDAPFRGDVTKHNPEDMLLASLSSCHMLWYLHLCADAGIIVTHYADNPTGRMLQTDTGGGYFEEVMLNPVVTVTDEAMIPRAMELHDEAHAHCFIANSMKFPVLHTPICVAHK